MKRLMVVALTFATMAMVSCGDKENTTPQEQEEQGGDPSYVFHYQERALEPGQTIYYYPKAGDVSEDWATTEDIFIENITNSNLQSVLKIEKVSGAPAFDRVMFCFGENCVEREAGWASPPLTLVPGLNEDLPIHVQYKPSDVDGETVYRITVGKGTGLANAQTVLLNLKGEPLE